MAVENVAVVDENTGEVLNIIVWDTGNGEDFASFFPGCVPQVIPPRPPEVVEPGSFVSVE